MARILLKQSAAIITVDATEAMDMADGVAEEAEAAVVETGIMVAAEAKTRT